jgi:hypothetical protein
MEFSLWRKDGVGDRYAVSKSPTNADWVGGYVIQVREGEWIIEGDTSNKVYSTAEDAAEVLIKKSPN